MAVVEEIWIKRVRLGPMDAASRAVLVAGRGIVGNADQGGLRQITLLAADRWRALMSSLETDLPASRRRANLVIAGLDLEGSRGRVLRVGPCRLRVHGETRPCEQMEALHPGLQTAMRDRWGGGAFAEVVTGGEIAVGDEVAWEEAAQAPRF